MIKINKTSEPEIKELDTNKTNNETIKGNKLTRLELEANREAVRAEKLKATADRRRKVEEEREQSRQKKIEETEQRKIQAIEQREQIKKDKIKELDEQAYKLIPTDEEVIEESNKRLRKNQQEKKLKVVLFFLLVIIPSIFVWGYEHFFATQMYSSSAVISVVEKQAGNQGPSMNMGFLGGNHGSSDTFSVFAYLESNEALENLNDLTGYIDSLASKQLDVFNRLNDITPLTNSRFSSISNYLNIAIDARTSLITIELIDFSSKQAKENLTTFISLAQKRMSSLNDRIYQEKITNAENAVAKAEQRLKVAHKKFERIQVETGVQDPESYLALKYSNIAILESKLLEINQRLTKERISGSINSPRYVDELKLAKVTEQLIIDYKNEMIEGTLSGGASVLKAYSDYQQGALAVTVASSLFTEAIKNFSQIKLEASLGKSIVQSVVMPTTSNEIVKPTPIKNAIITLIMGLFVFVCVELFRK